ncbi:PIN domain-containing protein [Candidatus Halobeggiatoa sp. HSG11]|nr:PIN domain-containing protein [Candidatus Halobeggiatoa sp. HSG11]
MQILVDTSVWVDYFRSGKKSEKLDFLIDENLLVINDVILAELIPFLIVRNEKKVIKLLRQIRNTNMDICWQEIIELQTQCISSGLNGIGIPDLLIAQNSKQHKTKIYSLDKHFKLMEQLIDLELY